MSVLILTEKSSQVDAIHNVFPLKRMGRAKKGEYRGETVYVFPLSGHILGTPPLTSRDEEVDNLPNLPEPDKFMERKLLEIDEKYDNPQTKENKKRTHKIYNAFKDFIKKTEIDRIIVATDPDYEGCAIAREVLEDKTFKLSDKNTSFMNISNISPQKLKEELDLAWDGKDAIDWRLWADIAYIRSEISNCIGIDVSHFLMKTTNSFTTFGTQQTRVVRLVVNRTKEHNAFDTSPFYRIRIKTEIGDFLLKLEDEDDAKNRSFVESIRDRIANERFLTVDSFTKKKKRLPSPKWYDGSDIASMASKELGKPIKEIFNKNGGLLQKLYEQGKMTYPRGDAKGQMPTSQFDEQIEIAKSIAGIYNADEVDFTLKKKHLWREDGSGGKGEIINHTPCTIASPDIDFSSLAKDERVVIDISAKMLLSCFYPDGIAEGYTVGSLLGGVSFEHQSSKDVEMGWRVLFDKEKRDTKVPKDLAKGDSIKIEGMVVEDYTKDPPPLFTEPSLLKELKKKKIGAESTFSSHIENLLDKRRDYAKLKGKYIIPTDRAYTLIELVPSETVDTMSIFEEDVFEDLLSGRIDTGKALLGRLKVVENVFYQIKDAVEKNPKLVDKLRADGGSKGISLGKCPSCGGEVMDWGGNSKQYSCQNSKKEKKGEEWIDVGTCQYRQNKHINNKGVEYKISVPDMRKLLIGEYTINEVFFKEKDKKTKTKLKMDIDSPDNPSIDFIFD